MRVNPEKREDKERVAHALLRVTLRLAAAHGFVSLGLREVSRAADIAPTSFYRHFADMEELGRALIDDLAGPFVEAWIERARETASAPGDLVPAIARQALASASEDAELLRFVVAEQNGAIPTFRAALGRKLSLVSTALREAIEKELPLGASASAAPMADAIVVLLLDACSKTLDEGRGGAPAALERLLSQIQLMRTGATAAARRG